MHNGTEALHLERLAPPRNVHESTAYSEEIRGQYVKNRRTRPVLVHVLEKPDLVCRTAQNRCGLSRRSSIARNA
jgi:hypothetical protein